MIVKFNFLSKSLGMQTNVTMCLPSFSFADELNREDSLGGTYVPGMKFQTMYLLHGGFGDDSDYVNFTNIARYADDNKLAVVMPCGYNSFYTDGVEGFIVSKYWEYVFEELPKVCESMFPISTKREDTYVGGLSMGSHGAMKMAVMGCERYAGALIMSGRSLDDRLRMSPEEHTLNAPVGEAVWENYIYQQAAENVKSEKILPKFYFTCGGDDMASPFVKEARDHFAELGYEVEHTEIPGYVHEWDFWDLALRKALYEWLPIKREVLLP